MNRTYTVKGKWPFPVDMLRHDRSRAATPADQESIDRLVSETPDECFGWHKDVEIALVMDSGEPRHARTFGDLMPNAERWKSFGWHVASVQLDANTTLRKDPEERAAMKVEDQAFIPITDEMAERFLRNQHGDLAFEHNRQRYPEAHAKDIAMTRRHLAAALQSPHLDPGNHSAITTAIRRVAVTCLNSTKDTRLFVSGERGMTVADWAVHELMPFFRQALSAPDLVKQLSAAVEQMVLSEQSLRHVAEEWRGKAVTWSRENARLREQIAGDKAEDRVESELRPS